MSLFYYKLFYSAFYLLFYSVPVMFYCVLSSFLLCSDIVIMCSILCSILFRLYSIVFYLLFYYVPAMICCVLFSCLLCTLFSVIVFLSGVISG